MVPWEGVWLSSAPDSCTHACLRTAETLDVNLPFHQSAEMRCQGLEFSKVSSFYYFIGDILKWDRPLKKKTWQCVAVPNSKTPAPLAPLLLCHWWGRWRIMSWSYHDDDFEFMDHLMDGGDLSESVKNVLTSLGVGVWLEAEPVARSGSIL